MLGFKCQISMLCWLFEVIPYVLQCFLLRSWCATFILWATIMTQILNSIYQLRFLFIQAFFSVPWTLTNRSLTVLFVFYMTTWPFILTHVFYFSLQSILVSNFRNTAAKMCNYLSYNLTKEFPQGNFRALLLKRWASLFIESPVLTLLCYSVIRHQSLEILWTLIMQFEA